MRLWEAGAQFFGFGFFLGGGVCLFVNKQFNVSLAQLTKKSKRILKSINPEMKKEILNIIAKSQQCKP